MLRQPFDDYMKNVNSPKQIDEVTYVQFRNGLGRTGMPQRVRTKGCRPRRNPGLAEPRLLLTVRASPWTGLEVSGDETELIALKFPGKAQVALLNT